MVGHGGIGFFAAPLPWVVHDLFADSALDDADSPTFSRLHCSDFGSGAGLQSNLLAWVSFHFHFCCCPDTFPSLSPLWYV